MGGTWGKDAVAVIWQAYQVWGRDGGEGEAQLTI